jgi:hypothetical protein
VKRLHRCQFLHPQIFGNVRTPSGILRPQRLCVVDALHEMSTCAFRAMLLCSSVRQIETLM